MPWYWDIILIGALSVVSSILFANYSKKLAERPLITKDGYTVMVNQLVEIEKKSTFNRREFRNLYTSSFTHFGEACVVVLLSSLLIYATMGNLIGWLTPVTNESIGVMFIALSFLMFIHDNRKSKRLLTTYVSNMKMEAPEEFKEYGRYAKNPFDVKDAMRKIAELEEEWDKTKTHRDDQQRKISEYQKNGQSTEWLQTLQEGLEHLNHSLTRTGSEITMQVGLISENLLTDTPSRLLMEIIQDKQAEEQSGKDEGLNLSSKNVPHYIAVMKEIASNHHLPEDIRARAERVIDTHLKKEVEKEKESEIKKSLIEIETVERYYSGS